jgi:hypothetical protein
VYTQLSLTEDRTVKHHEDAQSLAFKYLGTILTFQSLAVPLRTTRFNKNILHGVRFGLSVLYGSQNRLRPLLYTSLNDWNFITVLKSVYSAVPADLLYKADYVSPFKG